MESLQLNKNTKQKLLSSISSWYKKNSNNFINKLYYGVDKKINIPKYRIVASMERILRADLENDLSITDEYLEKIKKYINE